MNRAASFRKMKSLPVQVFSRDSDYVFNTYMLNSAKHLVQGLLGTCTSSDSMSKLSHCHPVVPVPERPLFVFIYDYPPYYTPAFMPTDNYMYIVFVFPFVCSYVHSFELPSL